MAKKKGPQGPNKNKRPRGANLVESSGRVNPGSQVRKGRTVAPGTTPQRRYTTADQYDRQYGPQPQYVHDSHRPPTGPVNPRLYERDIIDQVVNESRGQQPGSIPDSPGGGSSGGVFGGGGGTAVAEAPAISPEQAAFLARLKAMRDETLAGYGPSAQAIQGYYDTASKDLKDPYNEYMAAYQKGAGNLGLNFANDDNVKLADLAARKLQENYDTNEASDLATVEKMKALNTDSFTQMLVAAEAGLLGPASMVVPETGGGGGGGGGGRRGGGSGGGGSSGNPFSEKATQDEAFYNPGLVDAISGIADPELRDYADLVYAGTGTNPRAALNRAVADFEKFSNFRPPAIAVRRPSGFNPVAQMTYGLAKAQQKALKEKNKRDKKIAQAAVNFFKQWSPGYKPQTVSQKVSTTSTTKHK